MAEGCPYDILRKRCLLKEVKRSLAFILVMMMVLPVTVCAEGEKLKCDSELEAAIAFSEMMKMGENSLSLSVPDDFDYTLCYRYLSMLYRDSYVFEYVPSRRNAHIKAVYNDEAKHQMAEAEAAALAARLTDDSMGEYEKYYAIYSYLRDNCEYDMKAALNQSVETGDAFSAYGALIGKKAVCDGISSAFAMICRHAGLPCIYVGAPEMNHSWNAVLYNGQIRYLDVTYDMTGGTEVKYFMLDRDSMAVDHSWDVQLVENLTSAIWDDRFVSAYTLSRLGGLFRGSDKGWELDRSPSRAEAAIMLVRFLGLEDYALESGYTTDSIPFTDINPNHLPYITQLYVMGLTRGTSQSTFTPDEEVELRDYMTFMLRALGYAEGEQFGWETAAEDALGLGVLSQSQYDTLTREKFDRGMMAFASLAVLQADDADGRPLYESLCEDGVLDEKIVKDFLFSY